MAAMAPVSRVDFYFYTNEPGLQEINLFGYIKAVPLMGVDSAYGEGVYGTMLPPTRGQEVVTLNQWGSYWTVHQVDSGQRIDRAIHVPLPADHLLISASHPSVLVHRDSIELSRYQWQVWMLPEGIAESPAASQAQESYIEIEKECSSSSSSSDDDDDEEVIVAPTGEVFYADGRAVEDDADSEEEEEEEEEVEGAGHVTGPEWVGWPANGHWGRPEAGGIVDPYTAMMYGVGGMQFYEEEESDSSEDW